MKGFIVALAAVAAGASLSGCATVTRGTHTDFAVESTPPGAAVKTSTGFTCAATPCSMKMPRKESFDVTLTKDGYQPMKVHVASVISGAGAAGFVGNAVVGGGIGMVADAVTGAVDDLRPNPLKVTLIPNDAPTAPPPGPSASAGAPSANP